MNQETKICQNCKNQFTIEPEDFNFYEKIKVPPPTFCPECRFQRRLLFRNERNFYRRKCNLCSKNIIASYPADAPFPVYCVKCWWSDNWNPFEYGRDFDFSRPFFEQFRELSLKVPVLAIMNDDGVGSVNSEWSYDWAFSKNIYLCACGWYDENCLYSYYLCYDKDVLDCYVVNNSELVYEGINCDSCYNSKYCTLCFGCNDCVFGYDLKGCSNCLMCVGLRNKQYCILNQQYSKDEYFKKIKELQLGNRTALEKMRKEFEDFYLRFPRKHVYHLKSVNCTGNHLFESRMSRNCFYAQRVENCRFLVNIDGAKDCYDCNNTGNPELSYESVTPDNSRGNKFSIFCWKCTEAEYSNNCHSCVGIFGCTALKHVSYAILNKRYSKEEYNSLRQKIIEHIKKTGEWGEFFPRTLSPFAYNESAAIEWFSLSEEEAITRGYQWKGAEKRDYKITKTPEQLSENISEVDDSILNEIIACAHGGKCNERCTTAFRVVEAELQLYRRMNIPLPSLCSNCRHYARLRKRTPAKLWHRKCTCAGAKSDNEVYTNTISHFHGADPCPNEFETSYAPERKEIVYCEQCYNAEVV